MEKDFTAITTQEEFDERIKQRLERQKETLSKETQELQDSIKQLTEERDSYKSKFEEQEASYKAKLEEQEASLTNLQSEAETYKLANLKTKVALANDIPYELADRLQGEDEASLTEDARNIAEMLNANQAVAPLKSVETPSKDNPLRNLLSDLEN